MSKKSCPIEQIYNENKIDFLDKQYIILLFISISLFSSTYYLIFLNDFYPPNFMFSFNIRNSI